MNPIQSPLVFACAFLALLSLALAPARADTPAPTPRLTPTADGGWTVSAPAYTALVSKTGYLTSFKVGATQTLGRPFTLDPDGGLAATDVTRAGDTLSAKMTGKNGSVIISYTFRPDGFTIDPTFGGPFGRYYFQCSPALQGVELLNDKGAEAADSLQFVDAGEVRGVPAVRTNRNQMVRFHFPGFALHAYCQRWGAPYNYEGAGSVLGYDWDAEQLNGSNPLIFTLERDKSAYTLPALAFTPRTTRAAGVYDTPACAWAVDLGKPEDHAVLVAAGVRALTLRWQITDVHDRPAGEGRASLSLTAPAAQTVTVHAPGSGYYQILFRTTEASGRMRPSSFRTRFTVVRPTPGLSGLPAPDKRLSDYGVVGLIGAGANRESHVVPDFFTDAPQTGPDWEKVDAPGHAVWMNVKSLDGLFGFAASEGKATGVTWLFQANGRPAYATPPVYEAMAFALVSRYKDRCRTWEVENEPNFSYAPADYVTKCLVPFAAGAHRADPTCTVLGPDCVGLPETLRFAQTIYDLGANKSLDAVSTHTYPGPGESWEQFGNPSMLADLRHLMDTHGDAAKAIWQTEQGYAWDNAPKAQVARYVVRQFLQGWRAGILPSHQFYYYPHWNGFISMYQAGGGEAGSEDSWLPHAAALRVFAENTVGRHYAGDVPSPYKGIYLARFSGDASHDDVVAAWTFDFPDTLTATIPGLNSIVGFQGDSPPLVQSVWAKRPLRLPLSGEPVYIHLARGSAFTVTSTPYGPNLALASTGGVATASSEAPGHPASFANDGNWELWQPAGSLPGRTAWQSGKRDPSPTAPDTLTITFPKPRTLTRMVALCYLPAVSASPRDWEFQARVGAQWVTVGSARADFGWSFERRFAPITAAAIRMKITAINDGWFRDRRDMAILRGPKPKNFTDSRVLVSELEAYGPPAR